MIKNRKFIMNICLSAGILFFIVASSTLRQQGVQTVLGGSPPIYQHDNLAGREHRPLYVPGQLIVKFKKDVPINTRGQALAANQMTIVKALLLPDYALVEFDPANDVRLMAASLLGDPSIESAEPNYYRYADFTPNDPYYSLQWHFPMIHMPSAWDKSNGAGVTVAVLDTGVAYEDYGPYRQAPDLAGTTFVAGWDFVNEDSHPNDDNSHGTHVAGTIAQTTNNGIGVAGIAYGANIMPIKVLDSEGSGTDKWVADGIMWAVDHGAQVINLSLSGPAPSTVLETAVNYAYDNGVTVVAAAGNGGEDGIGDPVVEYPAAYENCIAVGAVRYDQTRSYYSNYGPALDLVAPGGDMSVAQNGDGYNDGVLQQTFNPDTRDYTDFAYWFFDGASMAAAHVSGVAALLIHGDATTPDEVRAALENTAKDLGPTGWDEEYGHGLIRADDAWYQSSFGGALVLGNYWDDAYAQANDHPELDVGDEAGESLTVEAWFYDPGSLRKGVIISNAEGYSLSAERNSPVPPRVEGCIGFSLAPPGGQLWGFIHCEWPSYSWGWHHIAGVFYKETGVMSLYMDGERLGTYYFGPAINNSSEPLRVGRGKVGWSLGGAVDEVRISDVVRYTGTFTPSTSPFTCDEHTRALWHFDEYDGATQFHDACGVDNLLTGYNGAHTEGAGPAACYDFKDPPGVGIEDVMQVASRWRTSCNNPDPDNNPDTPSYDPIYDIDDDCDIDIVDIMLVVKHWGETCD
ncbi:MAG: S8 family serine peptidase [Anaerolineae bacterium]